MARVAMGCNVARRRVDTTVSRAVEAITASIKVLNVARSPPDTGKDAIKMVNGHARQRAAVGITLGGNVLNKRKVAGLRKRKRFGTFICQRNGICGRDGPTAIAITI